MVNMLNHPVLFLLFVSLGVIAVENLLKWGFLALGWAGPAALVA